MLRSIGTTSARAGRWSWWFSLLSPLLSVRDLDMQRGHREAFKISKQAWRYLRAAESLDPDGAGRIALKRR